MSILVSVLVLLASLTVIAVGIYLALVAAKLGRLVDQMRARIDDRVVPWLTETRETAAKINQASTRIVETLAAIGRMAGRLEGGLAGLNPTHAGQRVAVYAGRALAIWLAGLSRATAVLKEKKKEE